MSTLETSTKKNFANDFPLNLMQVSFARYSCDVVHNIFNTKIKKTRHIIVGGSDDGETNFYEILWNKNHSNITQIKWKSFAFDYQKQNASLSNIGLKNGKYVHSYITQNNKYIIILHASVGYNVYDIDKDCWLLSQNNSKAIEYGVYPMRSLLISDEILIISELDVLKIYSLKDLKDPQSIGEIELRGCGLYHCHGLCCISTNVIKEDNANGEYSRSIDIAIIGGISQVWIDSIAWVPIQLDININGKENNDNDDDEEDENDDEDDDGKVNKSEKCSFSFKASQREMIEHLSMDCVNFDGFSFNARLYSFGVECVTNEKKEPVMIIIGGTGTAHNERSILYYNLQTRATYRKQNVK